MNLLSLAGLPYNRYQPQLLEHVTMKKITSFLTKKAGFLSNTRKIQQEADALRVLILTEYNRRNLGVTKTTAVASHLSTTTTTTDAANPATTSTAPDDTKAYTMDELLDATPVGQVSMREWLSDLSHDEVLSYNHNNLHTQVLAMFRALHQVHQHVYENAQAQESLDAADAHAFSKTQDTSNMHRMLKEQCGFCLRVDASTVSHTNTKEGNAPPAHQAHQADQTQQAVDGVYINGTARAGAVLGFFPGITYLRDRVHAGDFKLRIEERGGLSDYVYMRSDRSLVDGSQRVGLLNSFALGHLVRHPSKYNHNHNHNSGRGESNATRSHLVALPNVVTFPFDYPIDDGKETNTRDDETVVEDLSSLAEASPSNFFPFELRPYIPNAYNTPPGMLSPDSSKQSFAQGAVIIALNDLQDGDELFCDYRLNPSVPLPKWYCPVDEERSQRYWGEK